MRKTSVQLDPIVLQDMQTWPGLTQSEAIRLSVERAHYLSTLRSEEIAGVAFRFEPILQPALDDFSYRDYRTIVRALPAIVRGFLAEDHNGAYYDSRNNDLDSDELLKKLE